MSWPTVKLGDICTIEKGQTGIQKAIPGSYPLVVTSEERKSHNEFQFDDEAVIIPLVSGTGHGHASIKRLHYQKGKFALGSILCAVIPKDKTILNPEYLFRFLDLNKENELVARMRGMANVTLPMKEIAKIEIPLPPLNEQIAFVNDYKILVAKNSLLLEELDGQLNLIKQLRHSFLREAMQGKLVKLKYLEGQETGQQLLEKIKAEKAKLIVEKKIRKEKELAPITAVEIPFEIPENWTWCRLQTISNFIDYRGKTPNKIKDGIKLITAKNVKFGFFSSSPEEFISEAEYSSHMSRGIPKNGDLLFTTEAPLGNACILNVDNKFALAQRIITIQPILINNLFFLNALLSDAIQKQLIKKQSGATAKGIKSSRLTQVLIPLPPIQEQQLIVAKLNELMVSCDYLEQSIKESKVYNDMLLQQVLREALQPKEEKKVLPLQSRKIDTPLKTIIAGHIINLNNTTDFGRVKFQKLLYLTEHLCKIDFDSNYIKKVAGPYDDELIKSVETDLVRMRFFRVIQEQSEYKRVHYTALPGAKEIETLFLENFPTENREINKLLLKLRPLNMSECEVVATLYAVWNNRIINNETVSDQYLYDDFMAWSDQKVKYRSVVYKWLFWMKEQEIIPDGWGKYVDKPQKPNLFEA
jgi:type I restriction enzyme S subunit